MSKLYSEYLKRKKKDNNKYYLFKSGLFYIFLDEDAKAINKITPLNITNLNNDIVKCGFPSNSLDKYINVFNNLKLDIEIVNLDNKVDINNKLIKKIRNLDLDNITSIKAINILSEIKELVKCSEWFRRFNDL